MKRLRIADSVSRLSLWIALGCMSTWLGCQGEAVDDRRIGRDPFAAGVIPCERISADGRIIDDIDGCFELGGDPQFIQVEDTAGYAGSLRWTYATEFAAVANHGVWHLDFVETGVYQVTVYTAAGFAASRLAAYDVTTAIGTTSVTIDQSAVDGWQSLGDFEFSAGAGQEIRLDDNTGEALADQVRLAFDAVQLTRMDGVGPDASVDPTPVEDTDGGCAITTPSRLRGRSGTWLVLGALIVLMTLRRSSGYRSRARSLDRSRARSLAG